MLRMNQAWSRGAARGGDRLSVAGRRWPWWLLAGGGWAWLTPLAGAIEPSDVLVYSAGPVVLRPQFGLSESYTDNVLYQNAGAKVADFITTLSPGLNVELGRGEVFKGSIRYVFDQNLHMDRSDLDAGNHSVQIAATYTGAKVTIEGRDQISFLSDVLSGYENVGRNVERSVFSDTYRVEYLFRPKTGLFVEGSHSSTDYEEGIGLYDVNTLRGTAGFIYQAFVRARVFGEVYYGQSAANPNFPAPKGPHLSFLGGFLGARGEFTPRLSGVAKAGYESRQFAGVADTPSAPVFDVAMDFRVSERARAQLGYSRSTGVSVQSPTQSYVADLVRLGWTHVLGASEKWEAGVTASYGSYGYDQAGAGLVERTDTRVGVEVDLRYHIQDWVRARVGYGFDNFTSSEQSLVDYQVNRITIGISVGY